VIDVVAQLGDMEEPGKFYGYRNCVGLAYLYGDGRPDLAKINADNYRLFAAAAYFPPRPWIQPLLSG
jgi:hypothetical protein